MGMIIKGQNKLTNHKEYFIWADIKKRTKYHPRYAGRGIKMCSCIENAQNFLFWLGKRPLKNLSIERINNDGDYCACSGNLKWATMKEQANNRRTIKRDCPKGVYFVHREDRYQVKKCINGKQIYIGNFKTKEESIKALNEYKYS